MPYNSLLMPQSHGVYSVVPALVSRHSWKMRRLDSTHISTTTAQNTPGWFAVPEGH
jgi:hypothetical protein